MAMTLKSWIHAFRPKTLTAALVPIFVGTALAYAMGFPIRLWISLCALLASFFIQIGTNLINDAMDFKKGADQADRLGPRRITQTGFATFKSVFSIGLLFFLLALISGLPLVWQGGWPIVGIGLLSLLCGYCYTGGPYPFAYHGLGDLFVILFFGIIAVMGITYLHTNQWTPESLLAGVQVGCLATVMIAINNYRDMEGDRRANKRTLAVRFGPHFVQLEITLLIAISFLGNILWWHLGYSTAAFIPCLMVPWGLWIIYNVLREPPSPRYNQFLAQSAALHLFFGILLSLGFLF